MIQPAERVLGYTQITDLSTAQGLDVPVGTSAVLIQCTGNNIRWRADGINPTATVGMPLNVGAELRLDIAQLSAFRAIEQASSAVLDILFLG